MSHEQGEPGGRDDSGGHTHGPKTKNGTERWQQDRVARGVMPSVPLVVPLGEADTAKQINPVQLRRPVRSTPTETESEIAERTRQYATRPGLPDPGTVPVRAPVDDARRRP
ncbi:MAG: hypothetical protein NVS3B21_31510 [Acidimicrobiales bacterium]